jgi:16S rRNA (adenine1518-N6/adenine1519-N6)-dimethyltransferase
MPTKLGQNFLKDPSVVEKIIVSANIQPEDFVIEIGPGEGVLTEKLAKYAKRVFAIEIDHILAKKLEEKFENTPNVEIINADILKINLAKLVINHQSPVIEYKVVANLPYYITSPIIRLFLEAEIKPKEMILMVQKEVAERIVSEAGKMSILAVSVQYYAQPSLLFEVSKKSFCPIPKVDSAVIKIANISQNSTDPEKIKRFFRLVRAGFCSKRKTLANNLASSFKLDKKTITEKLEKVGLNSNVRAQELGVEKWKELLDIL